jgi:hypothetical protein
MVGADLVDFLTAAGHFLTATWRALASESFEERSRGALGMYGVARANRMNGRPAWGWLYAWAALALAPFFLVVRIVPAGAVRTLMEVVAALILIGTLVRWVRVNRIALELQGRRDRGWRQATLTAAESARPADMHHHDQEDLTRRPWTSGGPARPVGQKGPRREGLALVPRG